MHNEYYPYQYGYPHTDQQRPLNFAKSSPQPSVHSHKAQGRGSQGSSSQAPLQFSQCRLRILRQRGQERSDNGPAIQFADFKLYDQSGRPLDMAGTTVYCDAGVSPQGHEPQALIDLGNWGKYFCRTSFPSFPLEIEFSLAEEAECSAYSFTCSPDHDGRDPSAWALEARLDEGWTVLHTSGSLPPVQRGGIVGPFAFTADFARPEGATKALDELITGGCRTGDLQRQIGELLASGADPNAADELGRTILLKACATAPPSVVKQLIDYRGDVNAKAFSGQTCLHRLALGGDLQAMNYALQAGADPNSRDIEGDTPLIISCKRGDAASVKLLLEHGANDRLANNRGKEPLELMEEELEKGRILVGAAHIRELLALGPRLSHDFHTPPPQRQSFGGQPTGALSFQSPAFYQSAVPVMSLSNPLTGVPHEGEGPPQALVRSRSMQFIPHAAPGNQFVQQAVHSQNASAQSDVFFNHSEVSHPELSVYSPPPEYEFAVDYSMPVEYILPTANQPRYEPQQVFSVPNPRAAEYPAHEAFLHQQLSTMEPQIQMQSMFSPMYHVVSQQEPLPMNVMLKHSNAPRQQPQPQPQVQQVPVKLPRAVFVQPAKNTPVMIVQGGAPLRGVILQGHTGRK